jgi:hypothetical protein
MASQSHRMCVADSSFRHLSQMESSVYPSLKRCHFRWQCPVSSPTTHLSWSLFNFNRSFVLLAEGPGISPFACLSPKARLKIGHNFICLLGFNAISKKLTASVDEYLRLGTGYKKAVTSSSTLKRTLPKRRWTPSGLQGIISSDFYMWGDRFESRRGHQFSCVGLGFEVLTSVVLRSFIFRNII